MAISFTGAHCPPEVMLMGVRWYVAYALSTRHVDDLREEGETTFVKAIECERFRDHSTFAETEALAQDLEQMRCWFAPIVERDWFAARRRTEAEAWLDHCQRLLDTGEHDVDERARRAHTSPGTPVAMPDHPRTVDESHRLPCQRTPSPRSTATDGRALSP